MEIDGCHEIGPEFDRCTTHVLKPVSRRGSSFCGSVGTSSHHDLTVSCIENNGVGI